MVRGRRNLYPWIPCSTKTRGMHSRRARKEADAAAAELWAAELSVSAVVSGRVHARKDYGVLCDLAAHPDVVGLVTPEQVTMPMPIRSDHDGAAPALVVCREGKTRSTFTSPCV